MNIKKDTVVSVSYTLTVEGNQVDASGDKPLTYLHGHNQMIPGFESQLEGLAEGESYEFSVAPENAYGEYNNEAVVDLDKSIFLVDGVMSTDVFEGAQLRMSDSDGNPLIGSVVSIGDDKVKMDFNHILAGKTLNFTGKIEGVREATSEEVDHGHVHGEGGHQH
jgi:FKBP-type peptidyl-prolyl cis-trans isomerase SlyD